MNKLIIGKWEAIFMLVNVISFKALTAFPTLLLEYNATGAWLVSTVSSLAAIVVFLLMSLVCRKRQDMDLYETGGKFAVGIVVISILLTSGVFLGYISNALYVSHYSSTPVWILRSILILPALYAAIKGSGASIRATAISGVLLLFFIIINFATDITGAAEPELFPIFGKNIGSFVRMCFFGVTLFSDIALLFLIAPNIEDGVKPMTVGLWSICLSATVFAAVTYMVQSSLPNPIETEYLLSMDRVETLVQVGRIYARAERIFAPVWLCSFIMTLSIYSSFLSSIFNFKKKASNLILIIIIFALSYLKINILYLGFLWGLVLILPFLCQKKRLAAAVLSVMFLLTGCGDKADVDDLAYISAIGVDVDGDDYEYTFQFGNPSKDDVSDLSIIQANNLYEAVSKLNMELTKHISFTHIKLVAMSMETANRFPEAAADFNSTRFFRPNVIMAIISDSKAKDYLKDIEPKFDVEKSRYYDELFSDDNHPYQSMSFLKSYFEDECSVLPVIKNKRSNGIAVFSKGKLAEIQNGNQAVYFNILNNDLKYVIIDNCRITQSADTEITGTWKNSNTPLVNITANIKVERLRLEKDVENSKLCDIIKVKTEKNIKSYLNNCEYDVLNLASYFKRGFLTLEDWEKQDWDGCYKNAQFNVSVNVDFADAGTVDL